MKYDDANFRYIFLLKLNQKIKKFQKKSSIFRRQKIKIIHILIILFCCIIYNKIFIKNKNKISNNIPINHNKTNAKKKPNLLNKIINRLNRESYLRKPKYILLFDYYPSKYCEDFNSYLIFEYYQQHNNSDAFYIINSESDFFKQLLSQNKTKNLIPVNKFTNIIKILYPYLLNSKIIVQSYILSHFQILARNVSYLKYLKINHGIRFFKVPNFSLNEFKDISEEKANTIVSSPYEYELVKDHFINLNENNIYKAGLPRYDRFQNLIKNKTEKDCILISFTYRHYSKYVFEKSLYKINTLKLLNDNSLITFLKEKNIDLIFIQHHQELYLKKKYHENSFLYAKYKSPKYLSHYIEQCSLLVTDFSSISFDFMFQNKIALFYLIDYNDTRNFTEKKLMQKFPNKSFVKENTFYEQSLLINKIKYYVNNHFNIEDELKEKYESIFYYKKNITERIVDIINQIIEK